MNGYLAPPVSHTWSARIRRNWWHALWLPVVFLGLVAILLATEAYTIGIRKDQSEISTYNFGTEAMVGHGGWSYVSARAYAWSAATDACAFALIAVLLAFAVVRRSPKILAAAVLVFALYRVTDYFVGKDILESWIIASHH